MRRNSDLTGTFPKESRFDTIWGCPGDKIDLALRFPLLPGVRITRPTSNSAISRYPITDPDRASTDVEFRSINAISPSGVGHALVFVGRTVWPWPDSTTGGQTFSWNLRIRRPKNYLVSFSGLLPGLRLRQRVSRQGLTAGSKATMSSGPCLTPKP